LVDSTLRAVAEAHGSIQATSATYSGICSREVDRAVAAERAPVNPLRHGAALM